MNAVQCTNNGDRTTTILWAHSWGLVFLIYALLADIVYRGAVRKESSWDLLALLGLTGVVTVVYATWHKASILNRNRVIIMVVGMIVAAAISFCLGRWKLI
jgi:branched-subunit amino acid transport protein